MTHYVLPFLSDALGLIAFVFLVLRGNRSNAKVLVDTICTQQGGSWSEDARSGMAEFVNDYLVVADIQKRTNIAALISLGGVLGIANGSQTAELLGVLIVCWIILFFLSSYFLPSSTDLSRKQLRAARKKLIILFLVWAGISICCKSSAMIRAQHIPMSPSPTSAHP